MLRFQIVIITTSLLLSSSLDNSRDSKFHNLLAYALVNNGKFIPTIHYNDPLHLLTTYNHTSLQIVKLSMRMSVYLGGLLSLTLLLPFNNHNLTPQPS